MAGYHMYITESEESEFELAKEYYKEEGKGYKIG